MVRNVHKHVWSAFNQALNKCDPDLTTIGYMSLIQALADDVDTLNTVVQRCKHISEKIGQKYSYYCGASSVIQTNGFEVVCTKV